MAAESMAYILLAGVLVTAAATDATTGRVPNWLTLPAIAAGLLGWTLVGLWGGGGEDLGHAAGASVLGMLCGLIPYGAAFYAGGIGGGDVKLMAAVGAVSASWQVVLGTTVYALLLAVVLALVQVVRHGLARQTATRLAGAALMLAAKRRPDLPDDSPRVPFGLAIACGGLLAGAEHLLALQTPWAWLTV